MLPLRCPVPDSHLPQVPYRHLCHLCISSRMEILSLPLVCTSQNLAREVNAQLSALQDLLEEASTEELQQMLKERGMPDAGNSAENISPLQTLFMQEKTVLQGLESMRLALLLLLDEICFRGHARLLLLYGLFWRTVFHAPNRGRRHP